MAEIKTFLRDVELGKVYSEHKEIETIFKIAKVHYRFTVKYTNDTETSEVSLQYSQGQYLVIKSPNNEEMVQLTLIKSIKRTA